VIPPDAHITKHALDRFRTRWPDGHPPDNIEAALRGLLAKAGEEDIGFVAATRLLKNGLRPARYFTAEGWRFVTDEAGMRVLTCERILYSHPTRRKRITDHKTKRRLRRLQK